MLKINSETDLRYAILLLESRQAEEAKMVKDQLLVVYESIKPMNLLKSVFSEATGSHDLQDNLINGSVGLTAGYLSKVLFQTLTNSPVKKILGTAVMFGIKNLVSQHPEAVKSIGKGLFNLIRKMLHDHNMGTHNNETGETAAS